MQGVDVVREYVLLAFRLDRRVPGVADVFGSSAARERVLAEPIRTAPDLVRDAGRLADAVPEELGTARADFLRGQLRACEWTARRLAGQPVPYADEVAAAFGVRIRPGVEDRYRAAHRELDTLLPGAGPLADRLAAHRLRDEIPPGRLPDAVRVLSEALRARTAQRITLPPGEAVTYRVVADAPWSALHHYAGGYASRITLNAGARTRRAQLPHLLAHEAYPGHHTERCRKEAGLVARGCDEHRVVLAATPQALVAEGAAELGLRAVVGPGWGRWAAEVLAEVGLAFDGELAEAVDAATSVLSRARQDAALLLHGRGVPDAVAVTHIRRWMLVGEARAAEVVRFLRHPLWRSYTTAYVEGGELLRRRWEAGGASDAGFRRLLDEPLTPWAVQAELSAPATLPHPGLRSYGRTVAH